jgi:hypothetical protein
MLAAPMHLEQTKRESRKSAGPQYYLQNLVDSVKTYLRVKGVVPVALVTPYGATKTSYLAVSEDRKLNTSKRPVRGDVGHDRIQKGGAAESIGEAIRIWYKLPAGDFEQIGVDIEIIDDAFYLRPLSVKFAARSKIREIARIDHPLTFRQGLFSDFWIQQLAHVDRHYPGIVRWSLAEICRVMTDHFPKALAHIQEADLLRASGPLKHLGVSLGGYVGKGFDCFSEFSFLGYPTYSVPIEVKKRSRDFVYQQRKYGKDLLSRAVVLCGVHDHITLPRNIDVIELRALCEYSNRFSTAS